MKVSVVIPVYNEGRLIASVLERMPADYEVIVVDDGSTDDTINFIDESHATLLKHQRNRGKGVALDTGIKKASGDIVVFIDADMQHDPYDIPRLLEPIEAGRADFVIGARLLQRKTMPLTRKCANFIGNKMVELFCGLHLKDTQSGFRAVRKEFLNGMNLRGRFEVEMEMLVYAKKLGARIEEVSILTKYGEEKSHFKPTDVWRVIRVFLRI